jgi:D-threonate/D-erythronate kinase
MRVAIVADDLTGAADSAMEFTAPGCRVRVALGAPFGSGADVLSVDVDSREAAPAEAARRVAATVLALVAEEPELWYKKLDSTLRGNVAAELTAFAAATGCSVLLVAPAFPAQGRALIDGALWGDSQPVDRSRPVLHLPSVLAGAGRTVELLPLALVQEGRTSMQARLRAVPPGGIVVADALADGDLDDIVAAATTLGRRIAFAGSAGLAAAFGRVHGAKIRDAPALGGPARVLLIVGSLHPMSRRQLALAARALGPPLLWSHAIASQVDPPVDTALAGAFDCRDLLTLATPDAVADRPRDVAAAFALAAVKLIAAHGVRRIFCTGGEIARAVSDRLGIRHFSVLGRVQEGMPALRAEDGMPGLVMVTKAGGFGGEESMLRACSYLAGTDGAR